MHAVHLHLKVDKCVHCHLHYLNSQLKGFLVFNGQNVLLKENLSVLSLKALYDALVTWLQVGCCLRRKILNCHMRQIVHFRMTRAIVNEQNNFLV